jgi:hypothetical protein
MAEVKHRWKVTGDGMYFQPFWVEAETLHTASAVASDILAGGSVDMQNSIGINGQRQYKRHYRTVETHIVSIVRDNP